jgi:hypothetical protein
MEQSTGFGEREEMKYPEDKTWIFLNTSHRFLYAFIDLLHFNLKR